MAGSTWMDLRRRVKKAVPARAYYLATTGLRTLQHLPRDVAFARAAKADGLTTPLPPPYLRYRVAGSYDAREFHRSGREGREAFEAALATVDRRITDFSSILDFGVGCARILRWMEPLANGARLAGSDIDGWAISWDRRHVPFAECRTNGAMPPLSFDDGAFDLVYSHSVFTHLDPTYQRAWLEELRRVLEPGGVALLTVHGPDELKGGVDLIARSDPARAARVQEEWDRTGFFFDTQSQWAGVFPDFYQNSYQSPDHTREVWGEVMPVVGYIPRGMRWQDVVIVQRPEAG